MRVGDICTRKVVTALEFDDLTTAAELMRKEHIGYLTDVANSIRHELKVERALRP